MKIFRFLIALLCVAAAQVCRADFHTNTITTPGAVFAFSVDGSPATNPVINLVAGVTNVLVIQTSPIHPVVITTTSFNVNAFYSGASPQQVNNKSITVVTPTTGFPTTLYYMCHTHAFFGQINLTAPVVNGPLGANTILEVLVGTNIVMISTATNTTSIISPEFSSNLLGGAWSTVPNFTNSLVNGTNITVFDRLDPICGPNVFLRLRYDPPN